VDKPVYIRCHGDTNIPSKQYKRLGGEYIYHMRDDNIYIGDSPPLGMSPLDSDQPSHIDVAIGTSLDHMPCISRDDQGHMRYNLIHISHMYPPISYGLNLLEDRRIQLIKSEFKNLIHMRDHTTPAVHCHRIEKRFTVRFKTVSYPKDSCPSTIQCHYQLLPIHLCMKYSSSSMVHYSIYMKYDTVHTDGCCHRNQMDT
jgi:hypothetical protein